MHPNPAFRRTDLMRSCAFANERGFGVLTINAQPYPLSSHIPFLLSEDLATVEGHLVRSNPIVSVLEEVPQRVMLVVSGPDGYISPDWYDQPDQVPTWNYVAVHLKGVLTLKPKEELSGHLDRVSAHFENRLADKEPWTQAKMSPDVLERMKTAIVPFEIELHEIDATWKLNQNKEDAARLAAADIVAKSEIGQELSYLAALMKDPPS